MTSQRPSISKDLKNKLLVEANHACTICSRPGVQIHHIDDDPNNNSEDNLIVLCLAHHDEAEKSKAGRRLSSNLTPDQLREYKRRLKAGLRPAISQTAPASRVSADVSHVKDSTIIISAGDVSVTPRLESRKSQTSANQQTSEGAKPTIGIITALTKEYVAVKVLLENQREHTIAGRGAGRRYLLGEVCAANGGKHLVALALADVGNNIAAARATLFLEHFPNIDSIIMVGIAGGIPCPENPDEHVRLGDVVVSNQKGVIQYDFDRETISETIYRYPPRPPSAALIEGVRFLETAVLEGKHPWSKYVDRAIHLLEWTRPLAATDILASSINPKEIVPHPKDPKREGAQPRIFMGPIASANKLLKNPVKRDMLRDKFGVKAVEMEGSGIADATWNHQASYLVVRGICDYCDANKGDDWQEYAAVVAAAYTLTLLETIPGQTIDAKKEDATDLREMIRQAKLTLQAEKDQKKQEAERHRKKLEAERAQEKMRPDAGLEEPSPPTLMPACPNQVQVFQKIPFDLGTIWGLDRTSFIGLVVGSPDTDIYAGIVHVEQALYDAKGRQKAGGSIPTRWWIRIDPTKRPNGPYSEAQVWKCAVDQTRPQVQSIVENDLQGSLIPGIFFQIKAKALDSRLSDILQNWCRTLIVDIFPTRQVAIVIRIVGETVEVSKQAALQLKQALDTIRQLRLSPEVMILEPQATDENTQQHNATATRAKRNPFAPPKVTSNAEQDLDLHFYWWVTQAVKDRDELYNEKEKQQYNDIIQAYQSLYEEFCGTSSPKSISATKATKYLVSIASSAIESKHISKTPEHIRYEIGRVYRQFIRLTARYYPEQLEALIKVYVSDPNRQVRRAALIFCIEENVPSHHDKSDKALFLSVDYLMDAWLEGFLEAWGRSVEIAKSMFPKGSELNADYESGRAFIDDLALALIRHHPKAPEIAERLLQQLHSSLSTDAQEVCNLFHKLLDTRKYDKGRELNAHQSATWAYEHAIKDFIKSYSASKFQLAIRAGIRIEFPLRILDQADTSVPDHWWLLTAMPLKEKQIEELLTLDASRRAVFGLCTFDEWQDFEKDSKLKQQILECRRGRSLNFYNE